MSRILEPFSGLRASRRAVDLPVGAVIAHAGDLSNAKVLNALISQGWLPCDGREVKQTDYPELFQVLGMVYTPKKPPKPEEGEKVVTFRVPDYGGQFFRGVATGKTQDPGYDERTAPPGGSSAHMVGSTQACMVQSHVHDYSAFENAAAAAEGSGGAVPPATTQATSGLFAPDGTTKLSGDETRPRNIYVNYLIKASRARERMGVGL